MAICRPPNICPFCGELIKEIHDRQEGVPFMLRNIGDNFLRYEDHVCNPKTKIQFEQSPEQKELIENWYKELGIK